MNKNVMEYADEQLKQLRRPAMVGRQHPEGVTMVETKRKETHRSRRLSGGREEVKRLLPES